MNEAKVILDSISPDGIRLTTMQVTFRRFVLSEFNTHRVFSRNSASSRAIPIKKQIKRIKEDLAYPVEFGTNQKGMQAGPPLTGVKLSVAKLGWLAASRLAIVSALLLMKLGVHKQVTNRLLEPFMWHTVIVTSVDYENFFNQRCSPLAQPEIRIAAEMMRDAYRLSTPTRVKYGEWHTPYLQPDELDLPLELRKKISAARCARVSYLTQEGIRDYTEDLKLFDRLASADPPHWSPLEHVAIPYRWPLTPEGNFIQIEWYSGKAKGWSQYRHNPSYSETRQTIKL